MSSPARAAGRLAALVVLLALVYEMPRLLGGSVLVYSTCVTVAIFSVMAYGTDMVRLRRGKLELLTR